MMAKPILNCDAAGRRRKVPSVGARSGFTYVGVLFLIALVTMASALTLDVAEHSRRRAAEEALLSIGQEFSRAFESYYRQAPSEALRYPRDLQDLVKDPRTPGIRRHLRRVYPDPLTGQARWGLIRTPGGQIMGVYSLAAGEPARAMADVPSAPLSAASEATTGYAAWHFGYWPRNAWATQPSYGISPPR